jgi:K+-transporting ATPase ATPase C chain
MVAHLRRSIVVAIVLTGVVFAYALAGTGLSQLVFPHQANGSLTADGSSLIGQDWSSPRWFHGRPDDSGPYAAVLCRPGATNCAPSAGGDNPLEANGVSGESGATNLGPRSETLLKDTEQLVAYWRSYGVTPTPDLVTTSGSGYDPDISAADATAQIPMVAKATGIGSGRLEALIRHYTHGPEWGFLGSSWIDVLSLNQGLATLERR